MKTLTETAYVSRKVIKYAIVAAVAIMAVKLGWSLFSYYWELKHPKPLPAPDTAYGKLPALKFTDIYTKPQKQLVLQLIDTKEPAFPDRLNIYFVIDQESKYLSLEKTTEQVKDMGFITPPEKVYEDLYRFTNSNLNLTLTINPMTKTFLYQYPFQGDQTLMALSFKAEDVIPKAAENFLNRIGRDHADIKTDNMKVTLLRFDGASINKVSSLSEANLAQVDCFRDSIDQKYPVYPENLNKANISMLVSADSDGKRSIVEAQYKYFIVENKKFATYPLKTFAQAWELLQQGKYHLAKIESDIKGESIPIRKVYLAYLDPHYPTNFLQPVFVFEGDYDFVAFVPAISTEWIAE